MVIIGIKRNNLKQDEIMRDAMERIYTLSEFLINEKMSRSMFWRVRKRGNSPELIRRGNKLYITENAILEWRKKCIVGREAAHS